MEEKEQKFPSAESLVEEAVKSDRRLDINRLHFKTFKLMLKYRSKYYEKKVEAFLQKIKLSSALKRKVKQKMLEPVRANGKKYGNFMEETSRRISQVFQVISGNIAELCVEKELIKNRLKNGVHYLKKRERTDFTFYHPNIKEKIRQHRIEVKNVKLRERGTRGLAFDGDSMVGFFNDAAEFTKSNVEVIEKHCEKTGSYCYVPPETLTKGKHKSARLRPNTEFASDAAYFVKHGVFPTQT